jgi:hypothetical protein
MWASGSRNEVCCYYGKVSRRELVFDALYFPVTYAAVHYNPFTIVYDMYRPPRSVPAIHAVCYAFRLQYVSPAAVQCL